MNRLIRDANDIYSRPDFRSFADPKYKILTLNQALINSRAPTVSFSYQELKRQILGDALYEDKDGSSYLDPMYATQIDTARFKESSYLPASLLSRFIIIYRLSVRPLFLISIERSRPSSSEDNVSKLIS